MAQDLKIKGLTFKTRIRSSYFFSFGKAIQQSISQQLEALEEDKCYGILKGPKEGAVWHKGQPCFLHTTPTFIVDLRQPDMQHKRDETLLDALLQRRMCCST